MSQMSLDSHFRKQSSQGVKILILELESMLEVQIPIVHLRHFSTKLLKHTINIESIGVIQVIWTLGRLE